MSSRSYWPAPGATAYAEDGITLITAAGITIDPLPEDSVGRSYVPDYYLRLERRGLLLTYDPLGGSGTPIVINPGSGGSSLYQIGLTTAQAMALPLVPGAVIETTGRDTADDGGGCRFIYKFLDFTADNGGTVRSALLGTLHALNVKRVDARWFGARPSASAAQNTGALRRAFNDSVARGVHLYVPAGEYQWTDDGNGTVMRATTHNGVIGDGCEFTKFVSLNHTADFYVCDLTSTPGVEVVVRLEGFTVGGGHDQIAFRDTRPIEDRHTSPRVVSQHSAFHHLRCSGYWRYGFSSIDVTMVSTSFYDIRADGGWGQPGSRGIFLFGREVATATKWYSPRSADSGPSGGAGFHVEDDSPELTGGGNYGIEVYGGVFEGNDECAVKVIGSGVSLHGPYFELNGKWDVCADTNYEGGTALFSRANVMRPYMSNASPGQADASSGRNVRFEALNELCEVVVDTPRGQGNNAVDSNAFPSSLVRFVDAPSFVNLTTTSVNETRIAPGVAEIGAIASGIDGVVTNIDPRAQFQGGGALLQVTCTMPSGTQHKISEYLLTPGVRPAGAWRVDLKSGDPIVAWGEVGGRLSMAPLGGYTNARVTAVGPEFSPRS